MVHIRRATLSDVGQLTGLVEQYRAFYLQDSNALTVQFMSDRISRDESVAFVAEIDDALVGFTQCYPSFSTVSLSVVWLLNDLFVDPEHRGHGIANQLMAEAESAARDAGASRIWLRTAHTNTPAQALYESRGWVYDEVFKRYDLLLGS